MNKRLAIILIASTAVAALVIFFFVIKNNFNTGTDRVFDGSRVRDTEPDAFELSFNYMNKEDSEKFNLEAGEELKVSWNLEKGSMDLVIKNSAGEEIYKADGRKAEDKSEFSVAAAESGEYTVYVSAHKAKGNIKVEHK